LLDHFLRPDATLEGFANCVYGEQGDFIEQPYELDIASESFVLSREGHVWVGPDWLPVRVEKRVSLAEDSARLHIDYRITNQSGQEAELIFAPEFNLTLSAPSEGRYFDLPGKPPLEWQGRLPRQSGLRLVDEWLRISIGLEFVPSAELWLFPVRTLSRTTISTETIYQSSGVLAQWPLRIAPGESWRAHLGLAIERKDAAGEPR
jgi:4-alpha-glucanotransferase